MNIRKAFLTLLFLGLSVADLQAQTRVKVPRIGLVMSGSEASSRGYLQSLIQGLSRLGLTDGKNVLIEARYANGQVDQLDVIAAEVARSGVDIMFAGGDQGAWAAKRATHTIPIVAVTCDALAAGLVTNLARPGENLTGVTCINRDLAAKRVALMKETVPSLSRLGVVLNQGDRRMVSEAAETERAGKAYSMAVERMQVAKPEEIEIVLSKAPRDGVEGVIVVFDSMTFFHRAKLAEAAIRARIPTIFNFRQYVEAGGLLSYGPNLGEMYGQAARPIQKILNGERPGEIPMEQPTRFELVVNLKTAAALGVTIPESLLLRADEVIR